MEGKKREEKKKKKEGKWMDGKKGGNDDHPWGVAACGERADLLCGESVTAPLAAAAAYPVEYNIE